MASIEDEKTGNVEHWSDPVWPFPDISRLSFPLELQSRAVRVQPCLYRQENLRWLQQLAAGETQGLAPAPREMS